MSNLRVLIIDGKTGRSRVGAGAELKGPVADLLAVLNAVEWKGS